MLSAMLDKRKGVICMPESSFPQVLGAITPKERANPRWLAGLYRGSTYPPYPVPPTPLTIEDAMACMEGSDEEILFSLGKALARKLGKDPDAVKSVIWKTTRTIAMNRGPAATSGRFIVLRRHLHNVFDSQFRVDFGIRNRNPWRYAIFAHSYEWAFSQLPKGRIFEVEYETIPQKLGAMMEFLGIKDAGEWETGISSIEMVAKSGDWLQQAMQDFRSTDGEKRAKMDPVLLKRLDRALSLTAPVRAFLGPVRNYFDSRSLEHARIDARIQLGELQPA